MRWALLFFFLLLSGIVQLHAAADGDLKLWQKKADALQGVSLAEAKRVMAVYKPRTDRITLPNGTSFVDPAAVLSRSGETEPGR